MNRFKGTAAIAILATPLAVASQPASVSTARQYTFQGQGLYMTSKGLPENVIGIPSAQQQGLDGGPGNSPVKDFEHHNRYFGGN